MNRHTIVRAVSIGQCQLFIENGFRLSTDDHNLTKTPDSLTISLFHFHSARTEIPHVLFSRPSNNTDFFKDIKGAISFIL